MGAVFDEIVGDISNKTTRPIWMMRQAGRYLPEYRAVRAKFPSFLDFCYTPDAATQVTLQPIERFGFDAAIIFSDILVIPQALGQKVWFVTGEGPKLGAMPSLADMQQRLADGSFDAHLAKVYQAIAMTRAALPGHVDLFGFAGAPWTLLTYMLEGGSSQTYSRALAFADQQPQLFEQVLALVERAVVRHLKAQIAAGANIVQVFDSWAAGIPSASLQQRWCFDPLTRIAQAVSQHAPSVLFAKGLSSQFVEASFDALAGLSGRCAVAVGQHQSVGAVRSVFAHRLRDGADSVQSAQGGEGLTTQGNVDPLLMPGPWSALEHETKSLLASLDPNDRHVVNLGHGITPQGDADNVARWVDLVKETAR